MKSVASLFDYTGNMLKPWQEAGYECHIYDIQHPSGTHTRADGMITHGVDLTTVPSDSPMAMDYRFISCFPSCQHIAVSGAAWFRGKGLRLLQESIAFFATCIEFVELYNCPYMIENPRSMISSYWRAADVTFNPCDYSGYVAGLEDYTKETHLWHGNGFVMPPRNRYGDLFEMPDQTYIHYQSPSPERSNIRSATPMGFARAVFESNKGVTL